ncbi:hypothetical protein ACLOJK_002328 [Asimina triloba]
MLLHEYTSAGPNAHHPAAPYEANLCPVLKNFSPQINGLDHQLVAPLIRHEGRMHDYRFRITLQSSLRLTACNEKLRVFAARPRSRQAKHLTRAYDTFSEKTIDGSGAHSFSTKGNVTRMLLVLAWGRVALGKVRREALVVTAFDACRCVSFTLLVILWEG